MASSVNAGQVLGASLNARHPSGAGLLLFDLDDTIVQGGSHISSRVLDALHAAHAAGYVLSISSGRPLCMVSHALLRDGVMDYAICSNGATVTRLPDGQALFESLLSRDDALDCHALLGQFRPAWNAFFDDCACFEWRGASYMLTGRTGALSRATAGTGKGMSFGRVARLARGASRFAWRMLSNRSLRQVRSVLPRLEGASSGIQKMGCTIVDPKACAKAADILVADGRYEVVRMGRTELEITAAGVSKGTGAERLLMATGIDPRRSVAFGDGGNDLPLAAAVGTFVAMGNADDEVKAAATDVCPSVQEDGVAVWLEKLLQGGSSRWE